MPRAEALYVEAAYEEALPSLPSTPPAGKEDDTDRYRVLCLLALDRQPEAEPALEAALTRRATFRIPGASPRVLDFVNDVRQRVLPVRAEALYKRGRTDFEDFEYAEALDELTTLLTLLGEPEVGRLAELRTEVERLRNTAQERLDIIAKKAALFSQESPDPVYTRLTAGVSSPRQLSRNLPRWDPPRDQALAHLPGLVEVVIDWEGRVESARMVERLAPFYDDALVQAAHSWRFEPARRNGEPVRFRHQIEVIMRPKTKD